MILEATIGSTVYKLGVLSDSYSFDERCGDAGRHSTSSVSLKVRPFDLEGKNFGAVLFQADGLVPAVLKNGTTTVFTGYVRPFVSTSAKNLYSENISLEVMDPTESMHIYVWPSTETDPSRLKEQVWQNTTLKAIMTALFSSVGKTCDTSALPNESIPWIRTAEGDYINEVIARILYEFGYDYKWTTTGTATFFPTFVPSASMDSITDIRNTLATSRSDDTTEGVRVTYGKYSEFSGLLYKTKNYYGNLWDVVSASITGKFYKGVMHDWIFNKNLKDEPVPPQTNSWDFKNLGIKGEDGEPIPTSDVYYVSIDPTSQVKVWLDDEEGVSITPHLENVDATGMRFWVDYSGWFDFQWTWNVEIYGKIGYRVASEKKYRVTGSNPEHIDLKYRIVLNDNEKYKSIEDFAVSYAERQKASKVNYSFDSLADYTVGDFYHLSDPVGGRSQVVRVTSKSVDKDGICHYKCEGASIIEEIDVIESVESAGVTLPPLTAYQQALASGFNGTEIEFIASVNGGPKYKGKVSKESEIPTEEKTNACFLCTETFTTSDGKTYDKNYPYYWDGAEWNKWDSITSDNASAILEMLSDVNGSTDDGIFHWFSNIVADTAAVNNLVAKKLAVGSGTETEGFYLRIEEGNPPKIIILFNGKQLWKVDAINGKMYGDFAEVLQYMPFNFDDSLDGSHPFECEFYIPSSAQIKSLKLSARGQKYRAYSKSVALLDKGERFNWTTLQWEKGSSATNLTTLNVSATTYNQWIPRDNTYTGEEAGHAHVLPAGLLTYIDQTHGHTFDMSHSHDLSFGIYEGTLPSNVYLYIDNGSGYSSTGISLGSNATLAQDLELKDYITGTGWKRMKFTSSVLGRITAQLIAELLVTK